MLKRAVFPAFLAALLASCATAVVTSSAQIVSAQAYNRIVSAQGRDYYCAEKPCDTAPRLLSGRAPVYPVTAALTGRAGQASVIFDIDRHGVPENVVLEAASAPEFGAAAVVAVKNWRYRPATLNGKAVRYEQARQVFPFEPAGKR